MGYKNTLDISNSCSDNFIGAKECLEFTNENYNDWFLPSIGELYEMYLSIGPEITI